MMQPQRSQPASRVQFIRQPVARQDQAREVLDMLSETPKRISPKYFYDEAGSRLFEKITALDEYYPTRTECGIYRRHAADIARACGRHRVVIEPGAGSCEKIRLLISDLAPASYVPTDISGEFLHQSAQGLGDEYPWLSVTAIQADFCQDMALTELLPPGPRTLFYPGSTLGNFTSGQARQFLQQARQMIGDDGNVLIGLDMHKDTSTLCAAYNDRRGITARFNLNALKHLNQALDGNFDVGGFRHLALYNEQARRIEMYLEARHDQQCELAGQPVRVQEGERILTEYSHKYTKGSVDQLAAEAGLKVTRNWFDDRGWFGVFLLVPVGSQS